jgi:hypothetical protein
LRVTKARKRSRLVRALLMPALAVIWLVGWALMYVGHTKDANRAPQPKRRDVEVTLVPAMTVGQEDEEDVDEEVEAFEMHA